MTSSNLEKEIIASYEGATQNAKMITKQSSVLTSMNASRFSSVVSSAEDHDTLDVED